MAVARRRARRYAVRFTAASSLALAAAADGRRWQRHVPAALLLAAIATLVLALARPERSVQVPVERATIVLVTDHSRSMLATDVEPSRMRAAQRAARSFIDELPDQIQLGAVAYSDAPDAVQAPSENHEGARRIVDELVADGGTATGDALQAALETLEQQRAGGERIPAAIVLLSDGKTTIGRDPVAVAQEARRLQIPIFTISLGTESAIVPNPNPAEPPLPAPPDPESMAEIAEESGGRSFTAEDELKLNSIYESLGSQLGTEEVQRQMTSAFAVGGLVLLLAAAAASLRTSGRLP